MEVEVRCPKCGGRLRRVELAIPEKVEVRVPLLETIPISIKGLVPEEFKRAKGVAALICEECGYVELYLLR